MKACTFRVVATVLSGAVVSMLIGTVGQADPGEAAKVDAAVTRATAGLEQAVDAAAVSAPADPHQPVVIPGLAGDIALGLPVTGTAGKGVHTSAGTTVYPDVHSDANVAVQTLAVGARALVVVRDVDAPHEYRFPIGMPEGHWLTAAEDGSGGIDIMVTADDVTFSVGRLNAPWAKDARGVRVPTSYRLEGNTVIQEVGFDHKTAFPVTLDPDVVVNSGWTTQNATFSRRYTKEVLKPTLASTGGSLASALSGATMCGKIKHALVAGACVILVGAALLAVTGAINDAASQNQCFTIRVPHVFIGNASVGVNKDKNCVDK